MEHADLHSSQLMLHTGQKLVLNMIDLVALQVLGITNVLQEPFVDILFLMGLICQMTRCLITKTFSMELLPLIILERLFLL